MKVKASSLCSYVYCPRSVYLSEYVGVIPPVDYLFVCGLLGHEVRKRLWLRQMSLVSEVYDAGDLGFMLRSALEAVLGEVSAEYRGCFGDVDVGRCLMDIRSEVVSEISDLVDRVMLMVEDMCLTEALSRVTPKMVDFQASSDRLNLCGCVDLVMEDSGLMYPVEVKTCRPSDTVWEGDRLQVCAYGMLLEDVLGVGEVRHGFVLYTHVNERRPVVFNSKLRRKVLDTVKLVEDVLGGRLPEICPHGNGRKCESCRFAEQCYEI